MKNPNRYVGFMVLCLAVLLSMATSAQAQSISSYLYGTLQSPVNPPYPYPYEYEGTPIDFLTINWTVNTPVSPAVASEGSTTIIVRCYASYYDSGDNLLGTEQTDVLTHSEAVTGTNSTSSGSLSTEFDRRSWFFSASMRTKYPNASYVNLSYGALVWYSGNKVVRTTGMNTTTVPFWVNASNPFGPSDTYNVPSPW